jgi:hypothetical protein
VLTVSGIVDAQSMTSLNMYSILISAHKVFRANALRSLLYLIKFLRDSKIRFIMKAKSIKTQKSDFLNLGLLKSIVEEI